MNTLCGALLLFCSFNSSPDNSVNKTSVNVRENVVTVLQALGLEDSLEITSIHEEYILAQPRVNNGQADNRLWLRIQASRRTKERAWLHDNVFMSRLVGHGAYSFRQRARPSLQAIFYFRENSQTPYLIKLDVDRFPPSSSYVTSFRHFFQEMVPNLMLGKSTDQTRMAGAISRKYKTVKAQVKAPVNISTPIE